MNDLKELITSFCIGVVAVGLVTMLAPTGKMEKPMKMLIGFFLIAVLVSPFISGKSFDIQWDFSGQEASAGLKDTAGSQMTALAEESVKMKIGVILDRCEISGSKIELKMDISEDGGISIRQARVLLPEKEMEKAKEARSMILTELGIDVDVIQREEAENDEQQ